KRVLLRGGGDLNMRHGSDARKRCTAESHGRDRGELVVRAELAGGMTLEGKRKVDAPDAFAVVGDTDESAAPILDVDHNVPAASIKAVFNKFLDDCGGPFDHLAGGDTAHHLARKHSNHRRTARSGHRPNPPRTCPSHDFRPC